MSSLFKAELSVWCSNCTVVYSVTLQLIPRTGSSSQYTRLEVTHNYRPPASAVVHEMRLLARLLAGRGCAAMAGQGGIRCLRPPSSR